MDRITTALMSEFKENMEIKSKKESEVFESFVAHTVISKIIDEEIDIADIQGSDETNFSGIVTGGGNDTGIDALAITLNGQLIKSYSEAEDILHESNTIFEAMVIFVQAKTSAKFSASDMGTFNDGILDFLSEEPRYNRNEFIKNKWEIMNLIIRFASKVKRFSCKSYYVTTGSWVNDEHLTIKSEKIIESIKETNIFQEAEFVPIDKDSLREIYMSLQTKMTANINFPKKVLLPDVKGIDEAYIGYISVYEYLKLIQDESGNLRKTIFYDNIRDYQGDNDVNQEISKTLSSVSSDRLAVLNNGVTVISNKLRTVRDDITLSDFQVVNGCQTSYVIYYNQHVDYDDVYLPIKIVSTEDEEIINNIIVANNSQTEVKKEELIALNDIQKKLESFYNSFDNNAHKLYYERRSKQFEGVNNIEKVRIVTISTQLRSFCGMFLDVPHMSSRYYGRLFNDYSERAFDDKNELILYYTSAFALYKLEYFIRNKSIEQKYRKFKYHVLMLLKYYLAGEDIPPLNSKKIERYCEKINSVMRDNKKALTTFVFLIGVINDTIEDVMSNELTSKKAVNDDLLKTLRTELKKERQSK